MNKRILFILIGILASQLCFSQAPFQFNFQAVARNLDGSPVTSQDVGFRLSILEESPVGDVVYQEIQTAFTSNFGLANLIVGTGNVEIGDLPTLDWQAGPYYLQIEVDTENNGDYLLVGTSPLLSVPYALHAKTSEQAGPQGEQGIQGEVGPAGPQGEQGIQGETGAIGPQGIQGETGPVGPQGAQGEQGIQGELGPAGPQGIQGETGPAGPQGEAGPTGINGSNGLSAYEVWLALGNTGTETEFLNSLEGAQGPQGLPGEQGPMGPQGEQGLTGPQGEQGQPGESAIIDSLYIENLVEYYTENVVIPTDTNIISNISDNHGVIFLGQNEVYEFIVPQNVYLVEANIVGGNGGGGGNISGPGNNNSTGCPFGGRGGGPGGNGGMIRVMIICVPGDTIVIETGANGANGANGYSWCQNAQNGTNGSISTLKIGGNTIVSASAGYGGTGAVCGCGGNGGENGVPGSNGSASVNDQLLLQSGVIVLEQGFSGTNYIRF